MPKPAVPVSEPLPRYVELVRVSSMAQVDKDTPENQRRQLERLRVSRPGQLVRRIEFDFNVSATKDVDTRADMAELKALSDARAFDEVRIVAVDRLTRHADLRQRAWVWGVIADAKAKIVDVTGHVIDPESDMGEIDYYLKSLFAHREAQKIRQRTREGKERLLAEGAYPDGKPPYGRRWDKRTRTWSTDAREVALYRRLFELVLHGHSVKATTDLLNTAGELTKRGRAWHPSTVLRLLRDRAAYGEFAVRGKKLRIPPVVTEAVFLEAQKLIDRNKTQKVGAPPKYEVLLRRLLVCGECGATLHVHYAPDRRVKDGGTVYYYAHRRGSGACRRYHRAQVVDETVKAFVRGFLERDDVAELLTRPLQTKAGERDSAAQAVKGAERELRDLDRQEENLARLVRKGLMREVVYEKQLREIRGLRAAAEAALASARALVAAAQQGAVAKADVRERVEELRAAVASPGVSTASWRAVIALLFPRTESTGLKLFPSGEVKGLGGLPLDSAATTGHPAVGQTPRSSRRPRAFADAHPTRVLPFSLLFQLEALPLRATSG